uniref:Protein NRT1/ PTR FAMILY 8.3-like n=2 Tax=Nelumbo nucifera TaxID=4432 RepID=A0A822YIM2_NELNU|nr:TPA_asm: hypothetical protein HUJ06_011281 [Nelumbo nucifera]
MRSFLGFMFTIMTETSDYLTMTSRVEEERRLLEEGPLENVSGTSYTSDGSVDINGNPALKYSTGNWKACPFILGTEFCERLAYYGIAKNLITYLRHKLQEGNVYAAKNVATWQGTCYITPLIGAFLADAYWGRYWTVAVFSTVYFIGMVTLTLSASVPSFKPPDCVGSICPTATPAQHALFFSGLYLLALGTGGIKPCVSSFGADQFDDTDLIERVKKGSFFNWFYFSINIGSLISSSLIVWIQDNAGWGIGFAIPTLFMGIAIASFFLGTPLYRFQKPRGSPITRVCQVLVASFRKWNVEVPRDCSLLYELPDKTSSIGGTRKLEHSDEFKCLDKAAVVSDHEAKNKDFSNSWRLCTVTQGMVMDATVGSFTIPPASLSTADVISVIVLVPIYDRILVPIARKFTGKERGFSSLQRIGIGLFISTLAMVAAALVENMRLEVARALDLVDHKVAVPISIFWQIPQYFLVGTAEVFTNIGHLEFFYDQSPDAMRSLFVALSLLTASLGSYLNSLILTIVTALTTKGGKPGWVPDNLNEGHLDYYFWLLAGLSFLNLLVYAVCSVRYRYKKVS